MRYQGSIDRVEVETMITGLRIRDSDIEIFFENNDKITMWRDSYVALGMPTVWDEVKIILSTKPRGEVNR